MAHRVSRFEASPTNRRRWRHTTVPCSGQPRGDVIVASSFCVLWRDGAPLLVGAAAAAGSAWHGRAFNDGTIAERYGGRIRLQWWVIRT
ncbi:uncharacterized protein J3R85_000582 [Psidium guajava]|nr:uncharacterized protein J3R85_000582 [Psidium guajava]